MIVTIIIANGVDGKSEKLTVGALEMGAEDAVGVATIITIAKVS